VRKLQDCRKRKQDLQEETKNRKSAINEVKNCLRQIKTKLDKLKCSSLLQIADEPSMKDQIQQAQLQLAEMEKRKSSYRKAVYPPNYTKYRLPDSLASVALGRLVDLAFTEDDTHARLISSHLGDRVMSAVVFPRKENMEQYEQAPHRGCPAAVSLDVPSQAVLESIRNDLGELHIDFNWKLACDCVSTHNEGVGSLIKCLLKDTLVTDSLSSAKNLLEYCRNGNDLRAVPDVLSMDGYRVTGVGLVERLLDGPAESSFVFGEDHDSLSDMWQNWKKTVELLKAMHLTMIELEKKKRDYEEAVSRAKPELDQLSEKIATLDKQRCNMEGST
jgi:chromosome segregation ATPase